MRIFAQTGEEIKVSGAVTTSGAGTVEITSGHGAPVDPPEGTVGIYFDEDTGAQYNYYASAWH